MNGVVTLLKPRFWSFKNGYVSRDKESRNIKWMLLWPDRSHFWVGIFIVFYRVLRYFQGVEGFGDILAYKLLSMVLVTFFTLLIFSSIIISLSKFYLSRDLTLVHAMPVSPGQIFWPDGSKVR